MNRAIPAVLACMLALFAAALPVRAKEVALKLANLTLTGNLELADGKSLKDGVLLMVHGTLAHNRMETIATLQEQLKQRGINTLAINLSLGIDRRKGMFDCNQPMRHLHDDAVEEIAAWVDWLKEQGAGPIWLFGHSRGGNQVALYLLRRHDPAVKKAVLLAPTTYDAKKAAEKYEKRFGMKLDAALKAAETLLKGGRGDEPVNWKGVIYCKDGRATAKTFLSYHAPRTEFDTPSLLRKLPVPVLVIAGADDTVVPDVAERVKPLADGKRIRLVVIEDADHFFRDFAAEDAADVIAAYLKE